MALPSLFQSDSAKTWTDVGALSRVLDSIVTDLQRSHPSRGLSYLTPYVFLGAADLTGARGLFHELRAIFDARIRHEQALSVSYMERAKSQLAAAVRDLDDETQGWARDLPRDKNPTDEVTEVTNDNEFTLDVVTPYTRLQLTVGGIRRVGDGDFFRRELEDLAGLEEAVERAMRVWAEPKTFRSEVREVMRAHPPRTPLWWQYWGEIMSLA